MEPSRGPLERDSATAVPLRASAEPPTIVEGLYSFQIGGSEKLASLLARTFAARGYRVLALSFFDTHGPIRDELERAGIACDGLDVLHRSRFRRLTLPMEVRAWLRRRRPHVLHLHHGVTAIRSAREARSLGVPSVVLTEHSTLQLRTEPRYRHRLEVALPLVDAVTVVNDELHEYFEHTLGVPAHRVYDVPNAVDPAYADLQPDPAARARLGLENAFVYAFVGRLVVEKRVDVLLEAFRGVVERSERDVQLVLAGDGRERAGLQRMAARLGLGERVRWLGSQPDARLALSVADAFVLSSDSEGLPMALLEATAAGLPCAATDVGAIARVLGDDRGCVVPPNRPAELRDAMLRLLREPVLARSFGLRGRAATLRAHSIDAIADRYLQVFGLPVRWTEHAST